MAFRSGNSFDRLPADGSSPTFSPTSSATSTTRDVMHVPSQECTGDCRCELQGRYAYKLNVCTGRKRIGKDFTYPPRPLCYKNHTELCWHGNECTDPNCEKEHGWDTNPVRVRVRVPWTPTPCFHDGKPGHAADHPNCTFGHTITKFPQQATQQAAAGITAPVPSLDDSAFPALVSRPKPKPLQKEAEDELDAELAKFLELERLDEEQKKKDSEDLARQNEKLKKLAVLKKKFAMAKPSSANVPPAPQ